MPSNSPDPYARIAELYDLEHDEVTDDVDLYAALAEEIEGPVLELGCGSGRVLVPLAEAGSTVTGLDRSRIMLDRCRDRIRAAGVSALVSLVEGDMTGLEPAPGSPFGLVLFSLNALMHLHDPDQQRDALAGVRGALRSDGRVVIDVMNPTPQYMVDITRAPIREWSATLPGGVVVDKWSSREINPINQTIDTTLWYDLVDEAGRVTRLRTGFQLRYLHPHELELMLERAGFGFIQLFGGTDLDPLTEDSDRIIAIAALT